MESKTIKITVALTILAFLSLALILQNDITIKPRIITETKIIEAKQSIEPTNPIYSCIFKDNQADENGNFQAECFKNQGK